MSPFPISAQLLHDRGQVATAMREVLDVARRPVTVYVLTGTIGPFDFPGGARFIQKLRMLRGSGAQVIVIFGEDPERFDENQQLMMRDLSDSGVRVLHRRPMHAKLLLSRGPAGTHVFIGSANMTQSAMDWSEE